MSVKSNGDNNKIPSIDVKKDGVWQDWQPFFRPSFIASSSFSARYCTIGKTVHYEAIVKFAQADVGVTNPGPGTAMFLLPVNAKAPAIASSRPIGTAYYSFSGGGLNVGEVYLQATDDFAENNITYSGSVGILQYYRTGSTSAPIARVQVTTGDPVGLYGSGATDTYHTLAFSGTYEAA
jgi:hypothetical protein